ncbi:MAG: nucleotide exchange factor GrpE [Anaerofustis sp.]
MDKEPKKAKKKDGERMSEQQEINEAEDAVMEEELQQEETVVDNEAEQLRKELDELKETHLRLHADFDNFRKRAVKEKYEISTYAISGLMTKLIGVLDNFDRAIKSDPQNDTPFYQGMKMVAKQLNDLLTEEGLALIPTVGETFDPNKHYAVMTENDPDREDELIVEELQPGYQYQDKIIRPAMVKVNKR